MREQTTDLAVLERLATPAGKDLVDVGCGGGELTRALTARGARVTGIEVSEGQLATARARDDGSGAVYLIGSGQALPLADACADVVVFMRTLHHVPVPEMDRALREARRVLRRGGVVHVAEPLTEGAWFELTSLVEDELDVRREAQAAIARASEAGLTRERTVEYEVAIEVDGVDACRARMVSVDPERAGLFDSRRAQIEAAFQRLGEPGAVPGTRRFIQPMRADLLLAS
ncbi:MAG: class I SAM-dependent methyltransferase [Solirubrobacteraceae bacterium]